MIKRLLGDFFVHSVAATPTREMMLFTHGAYDRGRDGLTAPVRPQVRFYTAHGSVLNIDRALDIVDGRLTNAACAISNGASMWNYKLTSLKLHEAAKVARACAERAARGRELAWDWWTAARDTNLARLLLYLSPQYEVLHFLCCRFDAEAVAARLAAD